MNASLALRTILACGLGWTLTACGDDAKPSQSVTKSASSASTSVSQPTKASSSKSSVKAVQAKVEPVKKKQEPPKKPALPPETPEQVKTQCEGFLKAAWKTLGPAFAKLQIPNPDSFQSTYLTNYDAKKFVKVCTLISQEDRACMVASKDPIASVHHCGIDSTKSGGKTLSWPSVPGESPLFKPTDRPKGEGAAILKKLAGSWINKGSYRTEIWTIDGAGKTSVVRLKKDGTPDKPRSTDQFTLSFSKVLQGKRTYPKSNSQDLSFIMNDSEVPSFYASGNMLYGVYDLQDGKNFVFRDGFHWGVVQDGVCAIVTKAGQVLSAQCARGNGIDSDLSVTYQIPGKKRRRTGVLEPTKTTYKVVQNHALSPQLVRIGHYLKQSQ